MTAAPARPPRPLGAVLAGGASRRMGTPKALIPIDGRPLIEAPLAALSGAGLEAVVVAKPDSPLPELDVEIWHEPDEPRHPLCGIVTALRRAGGRPVVVLACDLPFVTAGLVTMLAERPGPVVLPKVDGRLQPLIARYDPETLPALEAALARREALRATVEALGPVVLGERELAGLGDPARLCANLNDADDLRRARESCAPDRPEPPHRRPSRGSVAPSGDASERSTR